MLRRTQVYAPALALSLSLAACSGSHTAPTTLSPELTLPAGTSVSSGDSQLGGIAVSGDLAEGALALYTIDLDPSTLTATTALKSTRQGAANDDLYFLSLAAFMTPRTFRVVEVGATATTLDLTWQFEHPFPVPTDPAGVQNAKDNRCDLGFAGQLLILSDVTSAAGNTYFTDVVANTALVANADGYTDPAGLLGLSGYNATIFPYHTLVDELVDGTGSRVGVSNGGQVTGNYGLDGWTRDELGAGSGDGWTGFGVLHQGQTTRRVLSLNRAELTTGLSLDVAVIVKYNDPRGGATGAEKRAHRLPPASPDAAQFAYRMPHGALDTSIMAFEGASAPLLADEISASTLRFSVVDWDARALETSAADLSEDAAFGTVSPGEPGAPSLSICIPGVLGDESTTDEWDPLVDLFDDDSAIGGDPEADSGEPGDALFYEKTVTKAAGAGQTPGTYTGLVRITDPQAVLPIPIEIPLDGSLQQLTADLPEKVRYQAFTIDLVSANAAPSVTLVGPLSQVASGDGLIEVLVLAYSDGEGDPIDIRFDWDNNGDFAGIGEGYQTLTGGTPIAINSPLTFSNATLATEDHDLPYDYTDGLHAPITGVTTFTLGPNRAPIVTAPGLVLASTSLVEPATFALDASGLLVSDPELDAITYTIASTPTSGTAQSASGVLPGSLDGYTSGPVMGPWNVVNSTIEFAIHANDALHAGVGGTLVPSSPLTGTVTPASCTIDMSGVNTTLATLTGPGTLRVGPTTAAITGVRVGWTDMVGELDYRIERTTWPVGTLISSLSFASIGTAAANATSYEDTTIAMDGTRYLYRVVPRCPSLLLGIASQLAMVTVQNFGSTSDNANAENSNINGWQLRSNNPSQMDSRFENNPPSAMNGLCLYLRDFGTTSGLGQNWQVFGPPLLEDRANFTDLSYSQFEFLHATAGNGSSSTGYLCLANSAQATVPGGTDASPHNWIWQNTMLTGSVAYNDSSIGAFFTGTTFSPIGTQMSGNNNWGNGGPVIATSYTGFDVSSAVITSTRDFIGLAYNSNSSSIEDGQLDDVAWIVY